MNIDDQFPKFDVMKRTLEMERNARTNPVVAPGFAPVPRAESSEFKLLVDGDRTLQSVRRGNRRRLICPVCHVYIEIVWDELCDLSQFHCACETRPLEVGDLVRHRNYGMVYRISGDCTYESLLPATVAKMPQEFERYRARSGDWYKHADGRECYLYAHDEGSWWWAQFPDGLGKIALELGNWTPVLGKSPKVLGG